MHKTVCLKRSQLTLKKWVIRQELNVKTHARRDPCYYYNTRPPEPASRELTSERCTQFVFCVSQTLQIPTYPELNLKLCISSESPCPPLHKPQLYMTNTGFNLQEMSSCGSARSQMHVFSGAVIKSVWCSLRAVCAVSELKLKVINAGAFPRRPAVTAAELKIRLGSRPTALWSLRPPRFPMSLVCNSAAVLRRTLTIWPEELHMLWCTIHQKTMHYSKPENKAQQHVPVCAYMLSLTHTRGMLSACVHLMSVYMLCKAGWKCLIIQ